MGETSTLDFMNIRYFPLSLIVINFSWFMSLPTCSISSWSHLEEIFSEYFYNRVSETKFSHLNIASRRAWWICPWLCETLHLTTLKEIWLIWLFTVCAPILKKNLNIISFLQTRLKDSHDIHRSHHPNMHAIEYHLDSSDDEINECVALLNLFRYFG